MLVALVPSPIGIWLVLVTVVVFIIASVARQVILFLVLMALFGRHLSKGVIGLGERSVHAQHNQYDTNEYSVVLVHALLKDI